MDLKESGLVEPETHWYYVSKAAAIKADVRKIADRPLRIIDVGAGSGYFASVLLEEFGGEANCIDTEYAREYRKGSINFTKVLVMQNANIFLFIDVLEHVSEPIELLRKYLEVAKSGNVVVISVPAFRSLWSSHDEFLGHVDRYQIRDVLSWLKKLGGDFEIVRKHYLFSFIFPAVLAIRKLPRGKKSDLRSHTKLVNHLLKRISVIDNSKIRNRYFGLSAYVVARVK